MEIENMTLDSVIDKIDLNNEESKTYTHLLTALSDWGEEEGVENYIREVKLFLGIQIVNIEELKRAKKRIKLDYNNSCKLESVCELIIFFKLRKGELISKPKKWFEFWKN